MKQIFKPEDFTLEDNYYCSPSLDIEFNGSSTIIEVYLDTVSKVTLQRSLDKINWYNHLSFSCNPKDIFQLNDLHPLMEYRIVCQSAFIQAIVVS